ncbi:hypothetical protein ACOACO_17945 [Nocardioides sp. CPCC 205120]|uniref:hypothetical protein n=1 Tax=Nocardioides sp. CPCC 205120 TaxID=3406462 RepID=UPI003B513012
MAVVNGPERLAPLAQEWRAQADRQLVASGTVQGAPAGGFTPALQGQAAACAEALAAALVRLASRARVQADGLDAFSDDLVGTDAGEGSRYGDAPGGGSPSVPPPPPSGGAPSGGAPSGGAPSGGAPSGEGRAAFASRLEWEPATASGERLEWEPATASGERLEWEPATPSAERLEWEPATASAEPLEEER